MTQRLSDIEDDIGETGVVREKLLAFVRLLPSSDVMVVKPMLERWVDELRESGVEIDEAYVARLYHDLEVHGRFMPETINAAPARPNLSLGGK